MAERRKAKSKSPSKEKKKREDENIYLDPEDNPFIVKNVKKSESRDNRRDLNTSEEIKIFTVGDAPVIDYIKDQTTKVIEYKKDSGIIDLELESVKSIDVSKAETVEIDGISTRKDLKKVPKADFKSLRSVKYNVRENFKDIKRNFEEYKAMCESCRSTMKCRSCNGKGKVKVMFKCSDCGGSGVCPDCGRAKNTGCPGCGAKLTIYATHCSKCGASFNCPNCHSPIPATATRCMKCRSEFYCRRCKSTMAPGKFKSCPVCKTKDWYIPPKRELPVIELEKKHPRDKEEKDEK